MSQNQERDEQEPQRGREETPSGPGRTQGNPPSGDASDELELPLADHAGRTASEGSHESAQGRLESPRFGPAQCDLCGAIMIERHCRLVCPACGYQRDCSDP